MHLMGRYHLVSTTATVQNCPHCWTTTLCGWSEGMFTLCDPHPLTTPGAQASQEAGRTVYLLSHRELVYLGQERQIRPGVLLPEHWCAQPVPPEWRTTLPLLHNGRGEVNL